MQDQNIKYNTIRPIMSNTVKDFLISISTQHAIEAYCSSPDLKEDSESTYESKHLFKMISDFQAGKMSQKERKELHHLLRTRLDLHNRVNRYVKILRIDKLPPIEDWREIATPESLAAALSFQKIYSIIVYSGLLSIPPDECGLNVLYYQKPARYLAASMILAQYDIQHVEESIERLWELYESNWRRVYVAPHKCRRGGLGSKRAFTTKGFNYGRAANNTTIMESFRKGWKELKILGESVIVSLGNTPLV